ncbi:uncharacterized protein K460DRAFT_203236 [Cucurbitaria berberidis CBS 394.84]|uniref:Uncharacterized protein n=1 Tax=Cucurbitaria berberidis CBS 394.84 TaxID=1168544 RepID=A0A9P4G7E9_9PLEO|nr:uncharacterized protein K460DRAFT_203236 [Cucurbitaria berberidis CBS 394.84]KAF1840114.1 hypothetical protein K460DRAFT_203236 [Cucurbitaria berberidis CBS 394.84]
MNLVAILSVISTGVVFLFCLAQPLAHYCVRRRHYSPHFMLFCLPVLIMCVVTISIAVSGLSRYSPSMSILILCFLALLDWIREVSWTRKLVTGFCFLSCCLVSFGILMVYYTNRAAIFSQCFQLGFIITLLLSYALIARTYGWANWHYWTYIICLVMAAVFVLVGIWEPALKHSYIYIPAVSHRKWSLMEES